MSNRYGFAKKIEKEKGYQCRKISKVYGFGSGEYLNIVYRYFFDENYHKDYYVRYGKMYFTRKLDDYIKQKVFEGKKSDEISEEICIEKKDIEKRIYKFLEDEIISEISCFKSMFS
jgi:hypothetical protein